jgi:hypothetical protein
MEGETGPGSEEEIPMTRQEALKKSLLFLQEWPDYEVVALRSDEETDRIIIHHRPTGEVLTFTAHFDKPAGN